MFPREGVLVSLLGEIMTKESSVSDVAVCVFACVCVCVCVCMRAWLYMVEQ